MSIDPNGSPFNAPVSLFIYNERLLYVDILVLKWFKRLEYLHKKLLIRFFSYLAEWICAFSISRLISFVCLASENTDIITQSWFQSILMCLNSFGPENEHCLDNESTTNGKEIHLFRSTLKIDCWSQNNRTT